MYTECQNCGTPLDGGYCPLCGQSAKNFDVPVRAFAKEFASEALSLDSRLRLTLEKLIRSPGWVAKQYVEGHRALFVPPVRLYLFASFAMFLILSMSPSNSAIQIGGVNADDELTGVIEAASPEAGQDLEAIVADDKGPAWAQEFERRLVGSLQRIQDDRDAFIGLFMNRMAQAMFFLLPAFAGILKLIHRKRLYVHHLVFSIYYHCFVFLVMATISVPSMLGITWLDFIAQFFVFWIPGYLFLSMRRFYGTSWVKTVFTFSFVSIGYSMLGAVTGLLAFLASALTF